MNNETMRIQIINWKQISIFVLLCLVVFTLVSLIPRPQSDVVDVNVPAALRRYLRFDESYRRDYEHEQAAGAHLSLTELLDRLEERTRNESSVRNWGQYGPVHPNTPTLVVLAHRDPERLQYLIVSLAQVHDIHTVLLVFSHGYYDERIDDLVQTIDFCMVKQIYYPNSVQLYPTSFPGLDVDDCSNPALDNSKSGVRRDGRRCEGKHHWWWTAHTVFGERWTWFEGHRGLVMFVREDSYVLPDLVAMMAYAHRAASYLPAVEIISLGGPLARNADYDKLTIATWEPIYENGLAFDRSTWAKIMYHSIEFCEYDDTSWSYSLLAVFGRWASGRALTVASWAPRVVSTGAGAHASGRRALAALALASAVRASLRPRNVHAVVLYDRDGTMKFEHFARPPRGNGGWSDDDRSLCLEPVLSTATEDDSTTTTTTTTTATPNTRPRQ